jgi:hypothetical protein
MSTSGRQGIIADAGGAASPYGTVYKLGSNSDGEAFAGHVLNMSPVFLG